MSDPVRPDLDAIMALADSYANAAVYGYADRNASRQMRPDARAKLEAAVRALEAQLAEAEERSVNAQLLSAQKELWNVRQQAELVEADREGRADAIALLREELANTRVFAFWDLRRERERCAAVGDTYAGQTRLHNAFEQRDYDRGCADGATHVAAAIRALPDQEPA